jgi:hypothetical protein
VSTGKLLGVWGAPTTSFGDQEVIVNVRVEKILRYMQFAVARMELEEGDMKKLQVHSCHAKQYCLYSTSHGVTSKLSVEKSEVSIQIDSLPCLIYSGTSQEPPAQISLQCW